MTDPLPYLQSLGFVNADAKAHFGDKEFEALLKNCDYVFRKTSNGLFQYVSIPRYEGVVVEVVLEEYLAEKNTRRPKGDVKVEDLRKRGFVPTTLAIFRSLETLKQVVL